LVQPTLTLPTLDEAPTIEDRVALSGTGGPGDELEILVDGEVVDTVTVNSLGRWSYQAAFDEAGDYELQVQLADSDAAEGLASESVALSIVPAPVQPTLTLPTLADEPTTADQISLSGTGGPGDALEVLVNGELVDTITVDSLGNWSYQADFEAAGDYQLQVQLVDSDGEAIAVSDPLSVSVAEPLTAPTILFPKAGGDVIAGRLTIIGTADPEAEVEVLNGDELLGTTEADANGEWLYTLDVTPDAYQFQARLTADNSLTSETLDTQVVFASAGYDCTINAGINRGDDYIVGVCDTMGTIIQDLDIEFEALLEANTQIENPDLIYPGEILVIPQ
jgi:hypothetical protein